MTSDRNADWIEGNLYFGFDKAQKTINFDRSGKGHGLSHLNLKAIDFILEDSKCFYFIEVKDPENPNIPLEYRDKNKEEFLKAGDLIDKLAKKFFDSLFFQSMNEGVPNKKFLYIILLCIEGDAVHFSALRDVMFNQYPQLNGRKLGEEKIGWEKGFDVLFFNLDSWNKFFPQYPVLRIQNDEIIK